MFSEVQFLPARYRTQTFAFLLEWSSGARTAWIMKQRSLATGVHWIYLQSPSRQPFASFPSSAVRLLLLRRKRTGVVTRESQHPALAAVLSQGNSVLETQRGHVFLSSTAGSYRPAFSSPTGPRGSECQFDVGAFLHELGAHVVRPLLLRLAKPPGHPKHPT